MKESRINNVSRMSFYKKGIIYTAKHISISSVKCNLVRITYYNDDETKKFTRNSIIIRLFLKSLSEYFLEVLCHGSHQSWKLLKFEKSPGKSWNFFEILEKSWNFFVVKQSKRDL